MGVWCRRIKYFYAMVRDQPGEAYRLLDELSKDYVNLLAFNSIPSGTTATQFVLFPEKEEELARAADDKGITLTGPNRAFLVQGDDEPGALVDFHRRLADAHVNVVSSSGVADGRGHFGYVIYVREEQYEDAARILGV